MHNPEPGKTESRLPIRWNPPPDIATPFATHILVQTLENEFKVLFYEVHPPIHLPGTKALSQDFVNAICISGVIVSQDRMQGFIDVLQNHFNNYKARKEKEKEKV